MASPQLAILAQTKRQPRPVWPFGTTRVSVLSVLSVLSVASVRRWHVGRIKLRGCPITTSMSDTFSHSKNGWFPWDSEFARRLARSRRICVLAVIGESFTMAKQLEIIWIHSDLDPETIRARRVSLLSPSGKIIPGNLEVEAADGHKMLVRVEYNADNPPGTVTLPRPAFRLTQQQFEAVIQDGPACVLTIPDE